MTADDLKVALQQKESLMKIFVVIAVSAMVGAGCATKDLPTATSECESGDSQCSEAASDQRVSDSEKSQRNRDSMIRNNRNRLPNIPKTVKPATPP